jgi:hydroxymethylbilane synthase
VARQSLRLGTRGSQLALWQARAVAARLAETGSADCSIVVITTSGDRLHEAPLSAVGGKRLFVKEIEEALLDGAIDLAVHSSKDMPALLPPGLTIAATLPREDPHDAVVLPATRHRSVERIDELVAVLGQSPTFGTSSVRRLAQLARLFPCARFAPVRGNLETRLRKLDAGDHSALVLAAAGLHRLGFSSRIAMTLPVSACVPAPGQGIVAVEVRADDTRTRSLVARIDDPAASAALAAERALIVALGGGCQMPVGALATHVGAGTIELTATVVSLDGARALRAADRGPAAHPAALGRAVAARLEEHGAAEILAEVRRSQGTVEGIQP